MKIKKKEDAMEISSVREVFRKILRNIFFDNRCSLCRLNIDRATFLCSHCLENLKKEAYLKNTENYYYVFYYDEKIRELIADYKLRNRKALGIDLAYLIRKSLEKLIKEEQIDVVIPVPISKNREKERGFNQVEYILDILKIEYLKIVRIKNTKHMYSMKDYNKRRKNVEQAFLSELDLSNKRVLLVDDIVTSGATINAISEELNKRNKNIDIKVFSIAISRKYTAK